MQKVDWNQLQNGSDIRGVALEGIAGENVNLTAEVAFAIGQAFARWLEKKTDTQASSLSVSVGRDSRLSGESLENALISGIASSGAKTTCFGIASTPAMFMSTVQEENPFDGAIMITASHLPFNRNGFKFFTVDGGLEKEDITAILELAAKVDVPDKIEDVVSDKLDFISIYAEGLVDVIRRGAADPDNYDKPLLGLRILVDAGNGAGGFFVDKVLEPLGADTTGSQFLEPDGSFPNHIPNPENKEAMESVRQAVLQNNADLGIIFDTDVDRSSAVDATGREINRNRIIALMAAIVLEEHPGTTIVTDSITSDELKIFIESLGGVHHRFKRGYRNVINESIRLNNEGIDSQLAIETSGHGALKENYFLDDGAYMIAKILIKTAHLKREGKTIDSMLATLKDPAEAVEYRLNITETDFQAAGKRILEAVEQASMSQPGWQIVPNNYEGVRVSFDQENGDGWFLIRMSLHDPILPLNIESRKKGGAKEIAAKIYNLLKDMSGVDLSLLEKELTCY
ncbi:MAG: phosphomannomutase/phosphoglucomutase [Clostridiaceae bacterium]|nr:phosphomannomutase/phosphoglucomutase [Clostridiaceae bacterium]